MANQLTNLQIKSLIIKLSIGILLVILFFAVHLALQNKTIYNATLGKLTEQVENHSGVIISVDKPFEKITNEKLIYWDGGKYNRITKKLYRLSETEGDDIFAFFPLFPLIWKVTNLSALGICIFNFLLFIIAVSIISFYLSEAPYSKSNFFGFLVSISLPTIIVYLIPYAEAVFILTFSIALIGLFKRKYWLLFLGLFLFAMVRSAALIIIFSLFIVEFVYIFKHRNLYLFFKRFFTPTVPLILGTLAVSLIQYSYGSGSLLKFMEVHKYWGLFLQIPVSVSDWSLEGFGLDVATLFMITIPCTISLIVFFFHLIQNKTQKQEQHFSSTVTNASIKEYLYFLSSVYIIGVSLYILFYQGGNIAGTFRYVVCSPFFYIMFFYVYNKLEKINLDLIIAYFGFAFISSLFVFTLSCYSTQTTFADAGFYLLILSLGITLFKKYLPVKLYYSFLIILISCNIIWSTYLFNCYLNNGWIIV